MVNIIIPEILSKVAGINKQNLTSFGITVYDVLKNMCNEYPNLREHLFYDNGIFKDHFLLVLNDENILSESLVTNNDTIEIIIATAGGYDSKVFITEDDRSRYARHLILPDIGEEGQLKIKSAQVLVVGSGGLGSPILLYLAAAGVGKLGIIDFDFVEKSNLQR